MTQSTIFMAIEDQLVLNQLKLLLEQDGYATEGTDDGLKALNTVSQIKPSVVILEAALFRMDGFKVCRFLKFDDQFRSIPVILLVSEHSEAALATEVGADASLTEPINTDNLIQQVKKLAKMSEPS